MHNSNSLEGGDLGRVDLAPLGVVPAAISRERIPTNPLARCFLSRLLVGVHGPIGYGDGAMRTVTSDLGPHPFP